MSATYPLLPYGEKEYESLTYGDGLYRSFLAALKAGTVREGGVERLFVAGVSRIAKDGVASSFDSGSKVGLNRRFNELLGFTEVEARELQEADRSHGAFNADTSTIRVGRCFALAPFRA